MSELINIRITKGVPTMLEIETAAARLGITKKSFLIESIKLMCALDKESYAAIKGFFDTRRNATERDFCAALKAGLKNGGS